MNVTANWLKNNASYVNPGAPDAMINGAESWGAVARAEGVQRFSDPMDLTCRGAARPAFQPQGRENMALPNQAAAVEHNHYVGGSEIAKDPGCIEHLTSTLDEALRRLQANVLKTEGSMNRLLGPEPAEVVTSDASTPEPVRSEIETMTWKLQQLHSAMDGLDVVLARLSTL